MFTKLKFPFTYILFFPNIESKFSDISLTFCVIIDGVNAPVHDLCSQNLNFHSLTFYFFLTLNQNFLISHEESGFVS